MNKIMRVPRIVYIDFFTIWQGVLLWIAKMESRELQREVDKMMRMSVVINSNWFSVRQYMFLWMM